jgi:DNA-binding HxlR family transcriptional regulator
MSPRKQTPASIVDASTCDFDATASRHESTYCPYFHHVIEVVGRRWNGVILRTLLAREFRFNELRASIPGLSDRLLTERLHELENEGLVQRQVSGECTRYALTEQGCAIEPILNEVAKFARTWANPSHA